MRTTTTRARRANTQQRQHVVGPLLRVGALLLIALTLAACGGKKSDAPATATRAAAETAPAATTQATTAATGAVAAPSLNAAFCTGWSGVASQTTAMSGPPAGSPTDLKGNMETASTTMKRIADQAPAEIRSDFQLLAKAWSDYATVMAKANYDFMRIASDPELQQGLEGMGDPKVQQAAQNVQAWAQKNCAGR